MMVAEEYAKDNPQINLDEISDEIYTKLKALAEAGALEGAEHLAELEWDRPAVGETLAEIVAKGTSRLAQEFYDDLELRTRDVVSHYSTVTRDTIREVLNASRAEDWSAAKLRKALQEVMPRFDAERIARTETHHAINAGRLAGDEDLAKTYGLRIMLRWNAHIDKDTCDYCREMNGHKEPLGEAFPDHVHVTKIDPETGEEIIKQVTVDPTIYNDFGKVPAAHPNCRCTFDEVVEFAE